MKFLLDIFFPKRCLGCGVEGGYLCDICLESISLNKSQCCPSCKTQNFSGNFCGEFCSEGFSFDRMIVCTEYKKSSLIKKLILAFKYRFCEELHFYLGYIMRAQAKNYLDFENTVIVPVPIHKKRLKFRGFNQTLLLANYLSDGFGVEFTDCLERNSFKKAQAKLSRDERLKNLTGSVSINRRLDGKSVVLIDDVATTGATLNECSRAMKEVGAEKVTALVLARG